MIEFGEGLAKGCSSPEKLWGELLEQLSLLDEGARNFQLLRGILRGTASFNRSLAEKFLDMAVTHKLLAQIYPWLQVSIDIKLQAVERIKQSLEIGLAPIWQYGNLAYGRAIDSINDDTFCELISLIAAKPDGITVAIQILYMRLHGKVGKGKLGDCIVSIGQQLISDYQFKKNENYGRMDHELSIIIMACFIGRDAAEKARKLSDRLFSGFESYDIYPGNYSGVLSALA